jgi:hypothetical protein
MSERRGRGTIQLRVGELRQLFNSIDPSPFLERDLDPDCEEFVLAWARELPPDRGLEVAVQVQRERPGDDERRQVTNAFQAHFQRSVDLQSLRLRRSAREGRLSLAIGLAALFACIGSAALLPFGRLGAFGEVLRESMIIAGWVVMWHPLEVLLYGLWPLARERRLLERLAAADVTVTSAADGG